MTDRPESDDQHRRKRARPKRGAFPAPKSEIDEAEPYVPDGAPPDESRGAEDQSTDLDQEKGG